MGSGQGSGWVDITPSIVASWKVVSVIHAQGTANGVGLRRDGRDQGDPQMGGSGTWGIDRYYSPTVKKAPGTVADYK